MGGTSEGQNDAERAHSEGSRQVRNALEQLRSAKKKGASLEDTLEKLNALQKQVKPLGEQLPPLPAGSSRRGRRSSSSTPRDARRASDTFTLPALDPERRRSASAPARGDAAPEHQNQRSCSRGLSSGARRGGGSTSFKEREEHATSAPHG